MLNHMALTGGRITVSLTALKLGLSTFTVGMLVAVFAVLPSSLRCMPGAGWTRSASCGRW
ncbi:inner membrane efflux protein [Bordetella pertussis]|nr:inner membrane efflux protein [Bordetella pertussis]